MDATNALQYLKTQSQRSADSEHAFWLVAT